MHEDRHGELVEVSGRHHHAGEGVLVHQSGFADEQVVLIVDAHSLSISICGLDCGLLLVLFDQQITRRAISFLLKSTQTKLYERHRITLVCVQSGAEVSAALEPDSSVCLYL